MEGQMMHPAFAVAPKASAQVASISRHAGVAHGLQLEASFGSAPSSVGMSAKVAATTAVASFVEQKLRTRRRQRNKVATRVSTVDRVATEMKKSWRNYGADWEVHKFGGASLNDATLYKTCGDLLLSQSARDGRKIPTAAIVSAAGGMTDALVGVVNASLDDMKLAEERLETAAQRQKGILTELLPGRSDLTDPVFANIEKDQKGVLAMLTAASLMHGVPPQMLELVAGLGEVWSAQTLAAYLKFTGVQADWVDAREVLIVADTAAASGLGEKGTAVDTIMPFWDETDERLEKWWETSCGPPKADGVAPFLVITGFICSTPAGRPTTLKRSGSDYSATIFAKVLGSASVTFWQEVTSRMNFSKTAAYSAVMHRLQRQRSGDRSSNPRTVTRVSQVEKAYQDLCEKQTEQHDEPCNTSERRLTMVMAFFIGLSILTLAAEIEMCPEANDCGEGGIWLVIESFLIVIFSLEIVLRMLLERRRWVRNWWSWFDVFMVATSVVITWALPMAGQSNKALNLLGMLRVARLARLIRLAKLIASSRQLYVLMMAWWSALQGIMYVYAMLVVGIFLYAMVGTQLIGRNEQFKDIVLNSGTAKEAFGSMACSVYTLFQLMTLQGFEETTRPLVMESPWLLIYFGSYIMFFTFGLINMLVGLIVERTLHEAARLDQESRRETPQEVATTTATLKRVFDTCDPSGTGSITRPQFLQSFRQSGVIRESLDTLGLPTEDLNSIYNIADWDGDGNVGFEEFIVGVSRLRKMSSEFSAVAAHAGVRAMQRSLDNICEAQDALKLQVSRIADEQAKNLLAIKMGNSSVCSGTTHAGAFDFSSSLTSEKICEDFQANAGQGPVPKCDSEKVQVGGPVNPRCGARGPAKNFPCGPATTEAHYKDAVDDIMKALRGHLSQYASLDSMQSTLLNRLDSLLQQVHQPCFERPSACSTDFLLGDEISAAAGDAAGPSLKASSSFCLRTYAQDADEYSDQHEARGWTLGQSPRGKEQESGQHGPHLWTRGHIQSDGLFHL